MSFDEFKTRYLELFEQAFPGKEKPSDAELSKIFLGILVVNEYQLKQFKKAQRSDRKNSRDYDLLNSLRDGDVH